MITEDVATDGSKRADARRAWLASLLLQRDRPLLSETVWWRFAARLSQLAALGRGRRKRLERKAAVSLAGAALALSLGAGLLARPPAVHAASITVDAGIVAVADDGQCSLIEAILNANSNSALYATVGECAAGSGADMITLAAATHTLTTPYSYQYYSDTGLPPISSDITIDGNGAIIERAAVATFDFRIMAVSASGTLVLNNTTLSGGYSQEDGGGLYNVGYALLQGSTISGNVADDDGGGLENDDGGTLILDNSLIDSNGAYGDYGGGVANEDGGILTIRNGTIISNNGAPGGGGVFQESDGGQLTIVDSTITGNVAIVGGGVSVYANDTVQISNSTISENVAYYFGGGLSTYQSTITIENSTIVTGNTGSVFAGGADFYLSTVTINDSTFSDNTTYGEGGGIHGDGSFITITRSTISGNDATLTQPPAGPTPSGGGIFVTDAYDYQSQTYVEGETVIIDSTISGNSAVLGGGLANDGSVLSLTNSTVSGNTAGYAGGGLYNNDGTLSLIHVTVTGNHANGGGGLYAVYGTNLLSHSLISGNTANAAREVSGYSSSVVADDFNVFGHSGMPNAAAFLGFTPGATDLTATSDGTDPTALAAILNTTLADNGGPTETHALVTDSPAIDFAPTGPAADQRGVARPALSAFDAGAYEYEEPSVAGFCPAEDPNVGNEMTSLIGRGMGSPTKAAKRVKLVVPDANNLTALYGQLAAVDVGVMKWVRFAQTGEPTIQINPPTSPAYRQWAVDWWGTELAPKSPVKAAFFVGPKAARAPRGLVLWPTYGTGEAQYANVFTTFDDSFTNHVYWNAGWNDEVTQVLDIPETQAAGAEITVHVALVDVQDDGRPVVLTVTPLPGGTPFELVLFGPNVPGKPKGWQNTLNLETIVLSEVPAGVNQIEIKLLSPQPFALIDDSPITGQGGDSVAMIGASAYYPCGEVPVR